VIILDHNMKVITLDKRYWLNRVYGIKHAMYFANGYSPDTWLLRKYLRNNHASDSENYIEYVTYYPKRINGMVPWMVGFLDESNLSRILLANWNVASTHDI